MASPIFSRIKDFTLQHISKAPKATGFIVFSIAGLAMARQCCLIAQGCAIEASKLSLQVLKEKSLESANKGILHLGLSFSVCQPQYYEFAAMGLAAAACTKLAYNYARDVFKPAPPAVPSPRKTA